MLLLVLVMEDGSAIIVEIFNKFYDRMLYEAKSEFGEAREADAPDAVQDIFVKLIENKNGKFSNLDDKLGQYFVISVRNHVRNIRKREERIEYVPITDEDDEDVSEHIFIDPSPLPEDELLNADSFDRLVSLIRQLKPSMRQILEDKYIGGYTNKEIAEMWGLSQSEVSTRLGTAKKRLYEKINREEARCTHD